MLHIHSATYKRPIKTLAAELTDAQIRDAIIQLSVASYPENCACPYKPDAGGRRCGARSAYSIPRGGAPLRYSSDVSDEMVARYRKY